MSSALNECTLNEAQETSKFLNKWNSLLDAFS